MEPTKEQIYDEQISPLLEQIIALANKHNIPFITSFQLTATEEESENGPLFCSAWSLGPQGCDARLCEASQILARGEKLPFSLQEYESLQTIAMTSSYELWKLSRVHDLSDIHRLFQQVHHPQPGDMVMEITTIMHRSRDRVRIGRLLQRVEEPWEGEWDEAQGARPLTQYDYIELPNGILQKWHGGWLIRVFSDLQEDEERRCAWVKEACARHGLVNRGISSQP